ncbi:MAG: hypothetical protein E7315_00330 [Clostridiales bacterium]|nr:hypothetical protein [Clostridiales bacterium]
MYVILILSTGMMGVIYASAMGERLKEAEALLQGLKVLKNEVTVTSFGMGEALKRAYAQSKIPLFNEVAEIFIDTPQDLKGEIEAAVGMSPYLRCKDMRERLTALLVLAEGTDPVIIEDTFNGVISLWEDKTSEMRRRYEASAPLIKKLGFLVGAVISVLML